MKRVAFHNLGCKVNSYELDIMRQKMEEHGYISVPFEEEAEVYVINTCTVTNIADRKSRQMIHKAKKRNPGAVVIAVGCYVETDPARVGTDSSIDLAIGNNKKAQIAELLDEFLAGIGGEKKNAGGEAQEEAGSLDRRTLGGRTMTDLTHRPDYEDMQLEDPGHTRAFVKIQDGCNQFCTYCIIPYARGRIRSRRPGEILREIRTIADKGIREVVLTGIHVSSYGLEWDAQTDAVKFDPEKSGAYLLDLMDRIRGIEGIERIRLSSLEPRIMTESFVRGIAAMPEVCPHFHLSLQSGCNATLRRMNRHYTTEEFLESVKLLRRYYENPAVTTDVIVGFPGESNAEFEETVRFLEEVNFYEMHVFKYSVRKGTAAAAMPVQIPEPVKSARSDILLEMTQRQSEQFRAQFIGKQDELLLEEKAQMPFGLCWRGHTKRYVEGYILCEGDPGAKMEEGQLISGVFTGAAARAQGLMFAPLVERDGKIG
ncbi:MAG: tRNA (N(6)-L-threonylcarbamoyladenosine(37)-C(2))-methylthiotransferase MtaB [Lachnospiraceae bacterium]|nr:tRNA (N(6)-L-threonylcarbamoyladenosine(37)-C(2))-methylthiotransferase MtaB [Lachnospiraceae bacterium]